MGIEKETSKKISIVIPAYNEEMSIGDVVRAIPTILTEGFERDIIVVDDGSSDETKKVAEKAGAKVIRHERRMGLGFAMRTAVAEALDTGAELIVSLDADGQHDPCEIHCLLEPILDNRADMVIGRRPKKFFREMPRLKRIGNSFFSLVLRLLVHIPISDSQCGFRAMKRKVAASLRFYSSYTYTQETLIQAAEQGFRIVEVPISCRQRVHGKSRLVLSPFRYGLQAIAIVFKMFRDYHPLLVFGGSGVVLVLIGIAIGLRLLYAYVTQGFIDAPTSFLLLALFITSGLQVSLFGLLADMLSRKR